MGGRGKQDLRPPGLIAHQLAPSLINQQVLKLPRVLYYFLVISHAENFESQRIPGDLTCREC